MFPKTNVRKPTLFSENNKGAGFVYRVRTGKTNPAITPRLRTTRRLGRQPELPLTSSNEGSHCLSCSTHSAPPDTEQDYRTGPKGLSSSPPRPKHAQHCTPSAACSCLLAKARVEGLLMHVCKAALAPRVERDAKCSTHRSPLQIALCFCDR